MPHYFPSLTEQMQCHLILILFSLVEQLRTFKIKHDLSSLENPAPGLEENLTVHPRPPPYLSSGPQGLGS